MPGEQEQDLEVGQVPVAEALPRPAVAEEGSAAAGSALPVDVSSPEHLGSATA